MPWDKSFARTAITLLVLVCLPLCREAVGAPCPSADDRANTPILSANGNHDTDIQVALTADKSEVAPGEKIVIKIRVDRQCYVTILNVDSTGQVVRLWPNEYSGDECRISPESPRELPGPGDDFEIVAVGPGGVDRLIAVATSEKGCILDADGFSDLPDTPFKIFKSTGTQFALDFRKKVDSLPASTRWGTAQLNLCVVGPTPLEPKSVISPRSPIRSLRDLARRLIPGHHTGSRSVGSRNGGSGGNGSRLHGRRDGSFRLSPRMVARLKLAERGKRKPNLSTSRAVSVVPSQQHPERGRSRLVTDKGLHILAFGVSTGRLQYCEEDARRLARTLQRTTGAKRENVRLLRGPQVTYNGMVAGMKWLISKTRPEDEVVVYFSGHGAFVPDRAPFDEEDGRDEVFVLYHKQKPRDYEVALKQRIVMLDDDFSELMKRIPAGKKLLIVDSCHSGTISKGEDSLPEYLISKFYPLADPETGESLRLVHSKGTGVDADTEHHALLSACLDSESSFEHQGWKGAVFTHFLLEAINTWKPDLQTAFWDARDKTHRFIQEVSAHTGGRIGTQTPQLTDPYGFSKAFVFSN